MSVAKYCCAVHVDLMPTQFHLIKSVWLHYCRPSLGVPNASQQSIAMTQVNELIWSANVCSLEERGCIPVDLLLELQIRVLMMPFNELTCLA